MRIIQFTPPPSTEDYGVTWTDVVYSPDGKSLTLYLEGSVPVPNSQMRGLSKDLAIAGHDYFEVVFHYKAGAAPNPANDVIARTSWELYKDARITGVRGKRPGDPATSYGTNSYTAVYGTGTNVAGTDRGAAILFIGKKTDRTLLAIGRLTGTTNIDGTPGNPATMITTNTRAVTFTVTALKSGVNVADSGFYTDYSYSGTRDPVNGNVSVLADSGDPPANTTLKTSFTIGEKSLPMYKLLQGSTKTHAQYRFALDGGNFTNYQNGIILAGEGSYGKKQPRYPTPNGQFQYASLRLDSNTIIEPVVNNIVPDPYTPLTSPAYFNPIIRVSFDTHNVTAQGSAFAFVFEIPVHPLSALPATDGAAAGTWYIRPSYDSFFLDLDDGTGAAGGAVLMGIGNPETNSDFRIRVIRPPNKYKYNGRTPNSLNNGRYFNVDGLVVWLETYSSSTNTSTPIRELNIYTELTYELGMKRIRSNDQGSFTTNEEISDMLYGLQTVTVRYTEPGSGATRTDFFYIICDQDIHGPGNTRTPEYIYTNDSNFHYYAAGNENQMTQAGNAINAGGGIGRGVYVIVLTASFDMNQIKAFDKAATSTPSLLMIVAENPNIVLGRQSDSAFIFTMHTQNSYYFGQWPFWTPLTFNSHDYHHQETINGQGIVPNVNYLYATRAYSVNADGSYALPHTPNYYTNRFIHYQEVQGSNVYNVTVDRKYATIINEHSFYKK